MYWQPIDVDQNRQPSAEEWLAAQELGRGIIALVEDRDHFVEQNDLDRDFVYGAGNWVMNEHNSLVQAYSLLSSIEWEEVKYLRFRGQSFSGFSLLHMEDANGYPIVEPVGKLSLPLAPIPNGITEHWSQLTHGLPPLSIYKPPCALGERGWQFDGVILNQDTRSYQERLTILDVSRVFNKLYHLGRPPRILEIGGGYGALACGILQSFLTCSYTICDLPEALLLSGLYLKLAARHNVVVPGVDLKNRAINLLPNYLFDSLVASGAEFDLVVNTLSMSEMSEYQVKRYADGIKAMIGQEGMFFEQNHVDGITQVAEVARSLFPRQIIEDSSAAHLLCGEPHVWMN